MRFRIYLNGSTKLLDNLDVLQVDVGGCRRVGQDLEDGVDGDGGQLAAAALRHDLGVERSVRRLKKLKQLGNKVSRKIEQTSNVSDTFYCRIAFGIALPTRYAAV